MNIEVMVKERRCTGCSACVGKCPTNAITLCEDEEGFLRPIIDHERCINCSRCGNFCPINEPVKYKRQYHEEGNYIAQSKDKRRKRSASGGLFFTIAKVVLENNGIVFGAGYNVENEVVHFAVEHIQELAKLQNSKYVQSRMGNSYSLAKEELIKGRLVLFSGTPCQIAGLYAYLEHDYENLITVDIICHGVPSPKLLRKQITEESQSWKGQVKKVSFRYKNPLFLSSSSFYMMMMMSRGLPIIRRPGDDPYFNIFSKGFAFRESCYTCPFACPNRVGDFTLGDCDSHRLYPDFHSQESNSTVMLNTEKARKIWDDRIKYLCDNAPLDIKEEIKSNKQLNKPAARLEQREWVYKDLDQLSWPDFSVKYANKQTWIGRIRTYNALIMPNIFVRLWSKINGAK